MNVVGLSGARLLHQTVDQRKLLALRFGESEDFRDAALVVIVECGVSVVTGYGVPAANIG